MEIGIIGLGDMGKLYAREFSKQGYRVNGCDLPERRSQLEQELQGTGVHVLNNGVAVSRRSDLIFYSVEAENIGRVVRQFGPSTKTGAIVAGQTSVKTPEIEAFERYLPEDTNIVTCHSLHGPTVSPVGQSLAVIRHRSSDEAYKRALETFEKLGSRIIEIPTYQEHDKVTADTQAVTHVGFESMGTAWKNAGVYPWENASYVGGIDNVKILMALRIYGGKSHVYSGLAILNPFAREQVKQYATSESELFKLMIQEDEQRFIDRIKRSGEFVFGNKDSQILLDDKVMGEFSLGSQTERRPNSHLSLLSMVDAWHQLGVNPYKNLMCQTPLFRLRLGIAEYLFRNPELLEESVRTALFDKGIRGDDLEFHTAVREWASIISHGDTEGYKQQFDATRDFFKERIPEGMKRSNELIKRLASSK
ncbi:prephenate dehydrogenase/arogenate dehydrogenase family protein [Candidatus Woesearchaeota archaeon]|nr:prephenate dehydrogenase/arogenate dehydrogenase family protein [Candidatus Woesearchaeota archaeon]